MNVCDAIETRCSVRDYEPKAMPEGDLLKILEAARRAPTARNLHHRRYVVIDNPGEREGFIEACNSQKWIHGASTAIACIIDPEISRWADTDMAIAMEHMVLQAVELGIGSCWVGAFDEKKLSLMLGVPDDRRLFAVLILGYPKNGFSQKPKESIEDIWVRDSYGW